MRRFNTRGMAGLLLSGLLFLGLTGCGNTNQPSNGQSETENTYKVGIIKFMDHASLDQIEASVQAQLEKRGEELGVTFAYEDYTYNGQGDSSTLNQIATQLLADDVDLIIPIATPAAQVVQAAVDDTEIPVVFAAVSDPVTTKLVADVEAPGGNITGVSDALNTEMILDLMFATNPDIQTVGLLYSKSEDSSTMPIQEAKDYLEARGIAYVEKTGTNTDEINTATDALIAAKVDAIFTPTDNTVMKAELAIFEKLQDANIPHFTGADSFALNGAFLGYGVNYTQLGQETADMAVEILVDGASPASMPVRRLENETVTVNTQVCEELGLDLSVIEASYQDLGLKVEGITTSKTFG